MGDDILKELRLSLGSHRSFDDVPIESAVTEEKLETPETSDVAERPVGDAAMGIAESLLALSAFSGSSHLGPTPGEELSAQALASLAPPDQLSGSGSTEDPQPALNLLVRGATVLLAAEPVVLGRGREAFNRTDDGRVSRRHCAVQLSADGLAYVIDLGSVNGTRIERSGAQIVVDDQWVQLKVGDVLVTTEGVVLGELIGDEEAGR